LADDLALIRWLTMNRAEALPMKVYQRVEERQRCICTAPISYPSINIWTPRRLALAVSFLATAATHAPGVRREKAALFQWVKTPPGNRSSRKQPEQLWR
jgi:hypothetical protein